MSKKKNPFYEKWDEILEYILDKDSPILKMEMKDELYIKLCCPTIMIGLDERLDNGMETGLYDEDEEVK